MSGNTTLKTPLVERKALFWDISPERVSTALRENNDWAIVRIFTQHSISAEINGVRVELFDECLRLASLSDLAAFKFDAIIEHREKKDYIDLYVIFQTLGTLHVLQQFKSYNPYVSEKSVLFALGEVETARDNKSVMPEMLIDLPWATIEHAMIGAVREFIASRQQEKKRYT